MLRAKALGLCMATLLLLGTGIAFGQCSWNTKVVLSQTTSDQPGLAAWTPASGTPTLYLMYVGTDSNRTLNAMESTNGTSWGSQTPLTGWQSSHGVALAGPSPGGCPYLMTAWPNRSNNVLYAATSTNGYQWSGPYDLTVSSTATPAIDPSQGNIAYKDPSTSMIAVLPATCGLVYYTPNWEFFNASKTPDNCPFSTFCTTTTNTSGSPAYPVPRAIAVGTNDPIWIQWDPGSEEITQLSGNYSGYGITGLQIPNTNDYYFAWRGGSGNINFWSLQTGSKICSDTSNSTPALAYFQGYIYVAWRSSSNNTINIASIAPF